MATLVLSALWVFLTAFAFLLLLVLGLFLFGVYASLYAQRLQFELPWLKWLTLEQVVAMGYSAFMCKLILPVFHEHKQLETRLRDDIAIPESDQISIDELGFWPLTVAYYEFKLTKRGGRRKRKIFDWNMITALPGLRPVRS